MVLRAEPKKQKTRRPERRGITRAVSPKKIGKERWRMSKPRDLVEKADPANRGVRFEHCNDCHDWGSQRGGRRQSSELLRDAHR
jgi:hypothetical protein